MITDIYLQNFRSYVDDTFEFDPRVNIIVGPNASGKTNLLESIVVLAKGSSYRVVDRELILAGKDWCKIEARLENIDYIVKIDNSKDKLTKTFEINSKIYKRLPLSKTIPIVLFEPNLLTLLTGSPTHRRDFFDNVLEQTNELFRTINRKYKKALTQRNFLLKTKQDTKQLFVWNLRLSELAGQIVKARLMLLDKFREKLTTNYEKISNGKEKISLDYFSKCNINKYEGDLLAKLDKYQTEELRVGFTLFGPHRDDITISIDGVEAASVASRGETRTILIGLKIIESQIIRDFREKEPILLLDDVFSELDGLRRKSLIDLLSNSQSFITTTDADIVVRFFSQKANIIPTRTLS